MKAVVILILVIAVAFGALLVLRIRADESVKYHATCYSDNTKTFDGFVKAVGFKWVDAETEGYVLLPSFGCVFQQVVGN